jgi:hypothetical protein
MSICIECKDELTPEEETSEKGICFRCQGWGGQVVASICPIHLEDLEQGKCPKEGCEFETLQE